MTVFNVQSLFQQNYLNNRFRLCGFFGNLGSGKTAMAVVLVRLLRERFGNLPIASNIELNLPNCRRYDLSELVGIEFVDHIIVGDEIVTQADARLSMTTQNIYYSYFVTQARKSPHSDGSRGVGNFVVYTAQLQSMADLRLFDLSNLYVLMEQLPSGNFYMEWVNDVGNSGESEIPCGFIWDYAKPFYNTDEKVMPVAINNMRVEMERFMPEKINRRVDLVVEDMLRKFSFKSWRDVQRFTVEDYLLRCGVPKKLGVDVFNRLRERVRCGDV